MAGSSGDGPIPGHLKLYWRQRFDASGFMTSGFTTSGIPSQLVCNGLASTMKPVKPCSATECPGVTADYSHGGPECDRRAPLGDDSLEKGYVLVYELAYERPVAKAVGAITLKTGEPAGIRTQDPRLKRAMLYRLSYRLTAAD